MNNEPGLLPPVPMAEHLRVVQSHAQVTANYHKAVRIIEAMKGQMGQLHAALAEAKVDAAMLEEQVASMQEGANALERRASSAEGERDRYKASAEAMERQLAEQTNKE